MGLVKSNEIALSLTIETDVSYLGPHSLVARDYFEDLLYTSYYATLRQEGDQSVKAVFPTYQGMSLFLVQL